ncbi:MAG: hypothetical protein ACP5UQ_14300, partial [Anaerolineae bacterium]
MTTAANNPTPSGQPRGRGLDALFDSAQPSASEVPEIDPELAAMLEREVRAGAPPVGRVRVGAREAAAPAGAGEATEEEAIDVPTPVAEPAAAPTPSVA